VCLFKCCCYVENKLSLTTGKKPTHYGFDEHADVTEMMHVAFCATIDEPVTIQEALSSEYSVQCKTAIDSEYQSLNAVKYVVSWLQSGKHSA